MESLKNRIKVVYNDLGRVLNSPESFGLGERAPNPLVNALTAMRQNLREELIETVPESGRAMPPTRLKKVLLPDPE